MKKLVKFFFFSLNVECNDDSDENNRFQPCVHPQCPEGEFICSHFRCMDNFKRCNGIYMVFSLIN